MSAWCPSMKDCYGIWRWIRAGITSRADRESRRPCSDTSDHDALTHHTERGFSELSHHSESCSAAQPAPQVLGFERGLLSHVGLTWSFDRDEWLGLGGPMTPDEPGPLPAKP